jgi:hypothetical protein
MSQCRYVQAGKKFILVDLLFLECCSVDRAGYIYSKINATTWQGTLCNVVSDMALFVILYYYFVTKRRR